MIVEKRWREFFLDPSQWWDHRSEKGNAGYPDFKRKKTQEALWVDGKLNPPWVETKLAALKPRTSPWNSSSWNKRLSGFVTAGQYEKVLELFQQMQREGVNPDRFTFTPVLNACARLRWLDEGRRIHSQIMKSGYESDVYVGSSLVDMYAKCGSIGDAQTVFDKMPERNVVCWNAMILGHVKCGQAQRALELFERMRQEEVKPVSFTFVGSLNACASLGALQEGKRIHAQIIENRFESDVYVGCSLIDMYAKCGNIEDAERVFNKVPVRNVACWNAMILGHVQCGQEQKASELFQRMKEEHVEPVPATFMALLQSCAASGALEEGQFIHKQIIASGFELDIYLCSSLVDMYAECGSIENAVRVFNKMPTRDVVCWNTMILGHVKCGQAEKALELYRAMRRAGLEPTPVTFVGLLNACASQRILEEGRSLHKQIIQQGCEFDICVASCLVDMYAKCGSIEDAWRVFKRMPLCDVVAWTAIILGHVKCGQGEKALQLFRQMEQEGVEPVPGTFMGALNACANIGALEEGRYIHARIIERGCKSDVFVNSCLVDMYAKCGSIEDAERVFNNMPAGDVVCCSVMIGAFATHGFAKRALAHFERMCQSDVQMDSIIFVSVLSACCHAGLVDEGMLYFRSMCSVHNISPAMEHYACMVDLLGRTGRLHEAEDFIKMMACEPNACVWTALLGACRVHSNVEMGERIARQVLESEPACGRTVQMLYGRG